MSGLGIAFPFETAAPLVKTVINNGLHIKQPVPITGLGLTLGLLCIFCLLPPAGWRGRLVERSLLMLQRALIP